MVHLIGIKKNGLIKALNKKIDDLEWKWVAAAKPGQEWPNSTQVGADRDKSRFIFNLNQIQSIEGPEDQLILVKQGFLDELKLDVGDLESYIYFPT